MEPVFDRARPYGEVYGSEGPSNETPRFCQDGHYFRADGKYLSSDEKSRANAPAPAPETLEVSPAVTDKDEVDALLSCPEGEELVQTDREVILEMVKQAKGPVLAGEDSARMMAAWLIKNTMPDVAEAAMDAASERAAAAAEAAAAAATPAAPSSTPEGDNQVETISTSEQGAGEEESAPEGAPAVA